MNIYSVGMSSILLSGCKKSASERLNPLLDLRDHQLARRMHSLKAPHTRSRLQNKPKAHCLKKDLMNVETPERRQFNLIHVNGAISIIQCLFISILIERITSTELSWFPHFGDSYIYVKQGKSLDFGLSRAPEVQLYTPMDHTRLLQRK